MRLRRVAPALVGGFIVVWGTVAPGAQTNDPIRIRIGTIVPKNSAWHDTLEYFRQEWLRTLGPGFDIRLISGGQLGDEDAMLLKVRTGQIEAVGLSSIGLSRIDRSVSCLQIPLMFDSWEELDRVRDRLAPQIERRIEVRGYKVLNWVDGGWVYAFSKQPAATPSELRKLKLFTSAGDAETERLYKGFGFNVVPLPITDALTSLQTGAIEAIPTVPLFAQIQGLYKRAPHMTDVRWTPLIGGTVIDVKVWERIPAEKRPALIDAAHKAGDKLRANIRRLDPVSIQEMQKRGLNVVTLDVAARASWQREAEQAWPRLRGEYCPADLFDAVRALREELRGQRTAPARPTGR
jgi:TRAP-type C4-dicarboxylate transport system substrate-binding protein